MITGCKTDSAITKKGNFGPNDNINREQLATILYGYAEYKGYNISTRADLTMFQDGSIISPFAKDAMQWAVAEGLVYGNEDGTLEPQGVTNRAICATIMKRFIKKAAE